MYWEEYADKNRVFDRNKALTKSNIGSLDTRWYPPTDFFDVAKEPVYFVKISGITHFWEEGRELDSIALMADLLCGLRKEDLGFAYVIKGSKEKIELFIGTERSELEGMKSILRGEFPSIDLSDTVYPGDIFNENITGGGIVVGDPTSKADAEKGNGRLQIDQFIRGMLGRNFIYCVMATAIGQQDTERMYHTLSDEMSNVYEYIEETKNDSIGTAIRRKSFTHANYFENLETMQHALSTGINRGLWHSMTLYASYGDRETPENDSCLANLICASFAGDESKPEMIRAIRGIDPYILKQMLINGETPGNEMPDKDNYVLGADMDFMYTTVLSSDQLAVITAIPGKEYPGYYIDNYVEFDQANRTLQTLTEPVKIGSIRHAGRNEELAAEDEYFNPYFIEKDDYTRHCLIIGITGGGKTNTSKSLLRTLWCDTKPRIPFLVIESAKREYWELRKIRGFEDLTVYTLGADDERTSVRYRLNPFETLKGVSLQAHIDSLLATFKAAFEMVPPMPYVLETAVYEIYKDRGWNIITGDNDLGLDLYPTMEDLYDKISYIVDGMGYHQEVSSNIKAALEARVHSLMIGGKGNMLNTPKSIPIGELLSTPTVLELEDIGDDETKSFVIGILMTQLYEYRKANMGENGGSKKLQHVLMIEEAHRLLKNVQGSSADDTRAKSVEFFCNMLAEIRTYGQAIFIADQVPTKLAPDTLKNTNLKIVHRTVAKEDRETVGNAMNMTEEQMRYLSSLRRGYAAVYAEGDNGPKYVKLPFVKDDEALKRLTRQEIIREIQERSSTHHVGLDTERKHCGCTYCPLAERCKNEAMIRASLGENDLEAMASVVMKKEYAPEFICQFFNAQNKFSKVCASIGGKVCLIGMILEKCEKLTPGKRKKIAADCLRVLCNRGETI